MIPALLLSAIVVLLLLLAYQDLRHRAVQLSLLIVLSIGIIAYSYWQLPLQSLILHGGVNLGFLLVQFVLISLYFSIKEGRLLNIADKYLGWGDIVFLLPVCLLFSPFNFILYYLLAIILTLLTFLIWQQFIEGTKATIPLVSGMAIVLIAALLLDRLEIYDRYTDLFIYVF
ncbi:MAG: hypothetical protein AAGG75_23605 [Bacteroidota bacterium]